MSPWPSFDLLMGLKRAVPHQNNRLPRPMVSFSAPFLFGPTRPASSRGTVPAELFPPVLSFSSPPHIVLHSQGEKQPKTCKRREKTWHQPNVLHFFSFTKDWVSCLTGAMHATSTRRQKDRRRRTQGKQTAHCHPLLYFNFPFAVLFVHRGHLVFDLAVVPPFSLFNQANKRQSIAHEN